MPRKNKPHSERRRKTKRYRNKNTKFDQEPKLRKYEKEDDFSWEEYSERDWEEESRR